MPLPIISADKRLSEQHGIQGTTFGKLGIGKTSLLWTLLGEKTLFTGLEAANALCTAASGKKKVKLLSGGVKA